MMTTAKLHADDLKIVTNIITSSIKDLQNQLNKICNLPYIIDKLLERYNKWKIIRNEIW